MDPRGEAMARDAFRNALQRAGVRDTRWRRGREPPDYYLRVGGRSYAVEVTRVMEEHTAAGVPIPTHGVRASLERLSQAIEREALRAGILSGSYGMTLAPVPNLRCVAPQLIAQALRYIGATRLVAHAPRTILVALPQGRKIAIQKVGASPNRVAGIMLIGPVKRGPLVQQELIRLLSECLERKRKSLSRVRLPCVLLHVDSYVYGELAHWRCGAAHVDVAGFHTVARVADVGVCQVLHSEEGAWSAAG